MPITVKQHRPSGYVVFRATASDQGIKLNGADAADTAGANAVGETVISMTISEILWSASTGAWTVTRGGNTVAILAGSGHHDYQAAQTKLEASYGDELANCNVTLSTGVGTILVKLHKVSAE